jgi:hypothetical protein
VSAYYCKNFTLLFNNYEFMTNFKPFRKEHTFRLQDLRVLKSIHKEIYPHNTICSMCVSHHTFLHTTANRKILEWTVLNTGTVCEVIVQFFVKNYIYNNGKMKFCINHVPPPLPPTDNMAACFTYQGRCFQPSGLRTVWDEACKTLKCD